MNIPYATACAADQVRAELEYRQAQMRLQQLENQVRIEVRECPVHAVAKPRDCRGSASGSEAGTRIARGRAEKAEPGGFDHAVLQDESALTAAESTCVSPGRYEKAEVEMDRATGLLLDHVGILLGDAERGQVTHMPNVPYVAPRQNPQSVMPQTQAQPRS